MHKIIAIANDPYDPESCKFWQKADSPWQLLAACFDLAAAIQSPDPTQYRSQLPVHQDGSCNGLQHYAALGRDAQGGMAVNLQPVEGPQDVYTHIADLVSKRIEADSKAYATDGKARKNAGLARKMLENNLVDRKLVKQTVMTSVYGVTFVGARGQISNRLRDKGISNEQEAYDMACYAAQVVIAALKEMFKQAKDIMKFLTECAGVIAKTGEAVQWTTPLGLPVIQPYRKQHKVHISTILQRMVLIKANDEKDEVQKSRQRSAFPPNYIHSVDSSHMMLTAIACRDAGLAFAGVHDSFWTHAGCVEQMNKLLRDKFVELHSRPLLADLLNEFHELYQTNKPLHEVEFDEEKGKKYIPPGAWPKLPQQGTLDLDRIKEATYFFN
jgi:DNA-directed RNA polymerase